MSESFFCPNCNCFSALEFPIFFVQNDLFLPITGLLTQNLVLNQLHWRSLLIYQSFTSDYFFMPCHSHNILTGIISGACELMIHCHLMPVSSPSWSCGSSRAEITLFRTVAYAELYVEILSKYWLLPLGPKTSSLWNSAWWPFLNPFLENLFPQNIRMLTDMWVWMKGPETFLKQFRFLQIFSVWNYYH